MNILITGSSGVIGNALCKKLAESGDKVIPFDLKRGLDIRNEGQLLSAMNGIDGVVHCAAISRVCDCENNPALCRETNITGTQNIVDCLRKQPDNPWLLFLSSREVYGRVKDLPVYESAPYSPINEYARSKVEGEMIVREYSNSGIIRLTNVYGSANDYDTRVVLAFAKAALSDKPLFLNGASNSLDFIHIDDAVNGICKYRQRKCTETIHLTSGAPITLKQLAEKVISLANSKSEIIENQPKENEVSCFYGNPHRASKILDWHADISLDNGIQKLIEELK